MNKLLRVILPVVLVFLIINQMVAGSTGKVIGKVTDLKTGEAIPGVNILVVGTTRGAATDFEGKYTIIGIPIGSYTVRASQVGYGTVEYSNVNIGADVTTPLEFKLSSSEVQIGGVTTTAEQLVNSFVTSGEQTTNSKTIESLPDVKTVADVLKTQAGFVQQGKNLFLRGGRANEVQYIVDGVVTNNLVTNSGDLLATNGANQSLSNLYAGVQSGAVGTEVSGLAISANAIQSVSVQTSGFDADYGNVQSGIINIVTKSGAPDKYTGSTQFRTDKMASTNQNESYGSFSFGGPEPLTKYLLPDLGLKLPGTLTFFFNGDMDRNDGYYNFVQNNFYNPVQRRIEFNGLFGGILNGMGFNYFDNLNNSFTFTSKLRYDVGEDQFTYTYNASLSSTHNFSSDFNYLADSSSIGAGYSINHTVQAIHFFNSNSFLKLVLGEVEQHDGNDVAGLSPQNYNPVISVSPIFNDLNQSGYTDIGTNQRWYSSETHDWSMRLDLNSQVHPLHLLKAGIEFHYLTVQSTEIDYPTNFLLFPSTYTDSNGVLNRGPAYTRGLYPGYGNYRWATTAYPNRGGAYIQDNIEFSGLNIHVGLRYDYLDIGSQVFDSTWIADWERDLQSSNPQSVFHADWAQRVIGANGLPTDQFTHMIDGSTFLYYATHGYFSPRLAIGYPVTDRIVFYFNYGHFLQFPTLDNYYKDPTINESGNSVGNPNSLPQRTVSYEAGFEDQVTDDMSFSIRAFYKDIFDYADNVTAPGGTSAPYNEDFASARGFDFTLNKNISSNLTSTITYSYQVAQGRSSNSLEEIYTPGLAYLSREVPLSWDQNHTVNLFIKYGVGPQEDSHIFGIPFNNYNLSLTWNFGSGFPYTGYSPGGTQTTQTLTELTNAETSPYTSTFNISASKGVQVLQSVNLLITLDITNLFNRDNVSSGAFANNTAAYYGRPVQYGDLQDPTAPTPAILPWNRVAHDVLNPTFFNAPRQILLGVKMNLN